MLGYKHNPSSREVEAQGLPPVWDQPGLQHQKSYPNRNNGTEAGVSTRDNDTYLSSQNLRS